MAEETKASILEKIDSKTKVLALVSLIAEALFLASLVALPEEQTLYALITCAVILVITIIGISSTVISFFLLYPALQTDIFF